MLKNSKLRYMRTKLSIMVLLIFFTLSASAQINLSQKFTKRGHKVLCIAYSPDMKYIATGGVDDRIVLWDAKTGNPIREMINKNWPLAVKFTPDGKYIVSAGREERVRLWDVNTGKMVREMKGHRDQILSMDISPDGRYAITGSIDKMIKLWDIQMGVFLKDFKGHRDQVSSVAFSPDGKKVVSGSADKTIKEWNVPDGTELRSIKTKAWVRTVAYSPDGRYIASGSDDKKITIWKNGVEYNTLLGHKHIIYNLVFSNDARYLISGGHDKFFILWEVETGRIVHSSDRQKDKVAWVSFSPDGTKAIMSDFTNDMYTWDVSSLKIPGTAIAMKSATDEKDTDIDDHLLKNKPVAQTKPTTKTPVTTTKVVAANVIDVDIIKPAGIKQNPNRYALIIGNEDYSSFQLGLRSEANVDFAVRDAEMFQEYAKHILGIPEENIIFLTNARAIQMHRALNKMNLIASITKGKADIFFYYAGHGFPDEVNQEPYIIPVDVSGGDLEFALKLTDVYAKLTEFPTQRVTVFLDACFSGGARNQGLVAARGVKVKPKDNIFNGNMVVFAASSGDESSLPYKDKQHGMFTYYLLKKLQETEGRVTYKELSEYITEQVAVKSILINNKEQNPQTNISVDLKDTWSTLKINP
ncbi:MAG: hypothetical protein A2W99_14930 [Bacteroidetes bacterium GWF2_33_16]|nr:MAG: hypothetical protein A2X00_00155 [Bacteroidetes bacterium GWE2_32_14]OFY07622.1 MAG: hypothetical protein A2W99_14930 [Bacteroidetes bacterium GWF2_33_16]